MLAPLNTPRAVVDKLARAIDQIAKSPDVREKMLRDGAEPVGSTPADYAKYFGSERAKWLQVIRQIGLLKD